MSIEVVVVPRVSSEIIGSIFKTLKAKQIDLLFQVPKTVSNVSNCAVTQIFSYSEEEKSTREFH